MIEIKNMRAIHDAEYIFELISQGEHENLDFKFLISDSRKIARSIAAFANNTGGSLLIGVKDNGNVAGVRTEEEFYMIEQAADMYCKPSQKVEQTLYNVQGKYVLKVDIAPSEKLVMAQDDNGVWQTYYRVKDENIQVPKKVAKIWRRNSSEQSFISFSDTESKMLSLISANENIPMDDMPILLHISAKTAENIISRLYSIGIISLVYDADRWVVKAKELPED